MIPEWNKVQLFKSILSLRQPATNGLIERYFQKLNSKLKAMKENNFHKIQ